MAYETISIKKFLDQNGVGRVAGNFKTMIETVVEVLGEEIDTKVDSQGARDVFEFNDFQSFPQTGTEERVYVDKSTNLTYRWNGSQYVQIGGSTIESITPAEIDALFE